MKHLLLLIIHWKATFFYKCYGNRAIPQSQHSLYCFRSKIRSAVNIIVGKWSVLNANIAVRSCGRRSIPEPWCHYLVSVAPDAVIGVCSHPVPFVLVTVTLSGGCKIVCAGAGTPLEPLPA